MSKSMTNANAQGAEVSKIESNEDYVLRNEVIVGDADYEEDDEEDYDPEYSYGEKCSLIDEFFEKNDLTYLRGESPSNWFEYHFNDNTFTMDGDFYTIEIQPDGWFNVESKEGRGIGEYDIRFMSELIDIKDELIEFLNDNYMLND